MIQSVTATLTVDGSGDATVYLGSRLRGWILAIKYVPGTLATGTDLVVTGETTAIPILTAANVGTSTVWYHPRAFASQNTDGADATDAFVKIPVLNERIKVVVDEGGVSKEGTMTVYYDSED
jgi:hypothetical protein